MRTRLLIAPAVLALVAAGCGGAGDDDAAAGGTDRLAVVASFYPLAEVAERVGGDAVAVQNLTPAGSEAHALELDAEQVVALEDADVVVTLGRGFQPAVEAAADRRSGPTLAVLDLLDVGAGEVEADGHEDDADDHGHDEEGALDPHVWLDPTKVLAIVDEVEAALVAAAPDRAADFAAGAEAYRGELEELDASFEAALASCERDLIVVSHAAFGWLTDRYGLHQAAIAGLSPEQEPDPRRMSELVEVVEAEGVTTVFTETLVAPDVAEALAREAGVGTDTLDPLEGLTDDQLADGETYLSVMADNRDALAGALGCA